MMRRLVIETAGGACSVALFDGTELVAHRHEVVARGHAERLMPLIADLGAEKPDALLVDCGPGSFTGLRVGLAAAIALGIGWGVPVLGFGQLSLLAAAALVRGVRAPSLLVAIEGGHGLIFAQRFATEPFAPAAPPASLPPEAVTAMGEDAAVVGNAAQRLFGRDDCPGLEPDARLALTLPAALRALPATPIYCRGADAKPMA